jgi:Meiotically up-regulated gene 113
MLSAPWYAKKVSRGDEMGRYTRHSGFGTPGNRINLIQSPGGVFFANYREKATGRNITRSLKTVDLDEAKILVGHLLEQQKAATPTGSVIGETVLYVIQRGDNGPIKVGISRRLKQRVSQLQNGSAEKLKILRVYKMADVEKAVHAELERKSRLENEWFPAELLSLVDRFFNVPKDVASQRQQKQYKAAVARVEHLERAGLL